MMKRALLVALGAILLTGCAAPPSPPPAPPAAQAAAPAAPPPRQLPKAEEFRVQPEVQVRTTKATRMYTGPGTWYILIDELPEGLALAYVGNREGWLRVKTPDGVSGYVPIADAVITDESGRSITYRMGQGRWLVQAEAGPGFELNRLGTGVLRLTLTGLGAAPEVLLLPEGAIAMPVSLPGAPRLAADVNEGGITRVSLGERGVLVDLADNPHYKVVESTPEKTVLEFRPELRAAESTTAGWRLQYGGDLRPVLVQEGDQLVLHLPGAMTHLRNLPLEEVGPEPGSAQQQQAGSATAQPSTRMPAGGLRLRVPAPAGKPFALYRPEPGVLELRYLTPGLAGKLIMVDPGHGGGESGAYGQGGNMEKEINLAVALKLKPLLEQAGARVLMTRTTDDYVLPEDKLAAATSVQEMTQLDLASRSAMANAAGADLFLSIHSNGGVPGEGGTETYWAVNNLNAHLSRKLSEIAQEELLSALGLIDRGAKQRPFNVIRMSEAPATLVELGFMTHPAEEQLLASDWGQQAAAKALLVALQRYFGG